MKLGMPQLFEYDDIEDNFRLAQKLGLDFIEFNMNFESCREGLFDDTIKNLAEQYNKEITLHFYDEADFGSYPEITRGYLMLLDKYASLGQGFVKQMNVHLISGPVVTIAGKKNYIYEKEYNRYTSRLLYNLGKARKICKKYGINLVIENTENMPHFMKKVYMELFHMDFRFCYDIGHDYVSNYLLEYMLNECALPFDEFHIHDAKNRTKCHLALGEGVVDLKYFKYLAESYQSSYVVIEVKQESDLVTSIPYFRNL